MRKGKKILLPLCQIDEKSAFVDDKRIHSQDLSKSDLREHQGIYIEKIRNKYIFIL